MKQNLDEAPCAECGWLVSKLAGHLNGAGSSNTVVCANCLYDIYPKYLQLTGRADHVAPIAVELPR